MNGALGVITLEEAKQALVVDFPDQNDYIQHLILTAVDRVERYTSHYLYNRNMEIHTVGQSETDIAAYPIEVTGIKSGASYTVRRGTLKTYVKTTPYSTIMANVGYSDRNCIPPALIDACYKIITYLYQNRDAYSATLPNDVQLLLNQYRRGII